MGTISRTEPLQHANRERREPDYTTTDQYPNLADVSETIETPSKYLRQEDLQFDDSPHNLIRPVPISIETRKLVVVEYGQQAGTVTLDGSGNGQIDFGFIPPNQWWLIDNVIHHGGAAGNGVLYERGAVGQVIDSDLFYCVTLSGPNFMASGYPNQEVLRPGSKVIAGFFGAGAAAAGMCKIKYRVAVMTPGRQDNI